MDHAKVLAEHDETVRKLPFTDDARVRFEWDGPIFRFSGPGTDTFWNGIAWYDLTAEEAASAIARQIDYFRALGHSFEWKVYGHDNPREIGRYLEAAGFVPDEEEGFAVLDLQTTLSCRDLPQGIEIRKIETLNGLDAIEELSVAVYGDPGHAAAHVEGLKQEFRNAPDTIAFYGAYAGVELERDPEKWVTGFPEKSSANQNLERDRDSIKADHALVSAGWIRFQAGTRFASLWGGATLPEWRGKGIYSRLVAIRGAEARQKGFRWLTVDCGPDSRPILERRGFEVLTSTTPWIWKP